MDYVLAGALLLIAIGFADSGTAAGAPAWHGAAGMVLLLLAFVVVSLRPIARISARPRDPVRALMVAPPRNKPEKREADRVVLMLAALLSLWAIVTFGPWPGRSADLNSLATVLVGAAAAAGWYWTWRDRIAD